MSNSLYHNLFFIFFQDIKILSLSFFVYLLSIVHKGLSFVQLFSVFLILCLPTQQTI